MSSFLSDKIFLFIYSCYSRDSVWNRDFPKQYFHGIWNLDMNSKKNVLSFHSVEKKCCYFFLTSHYEAWIFNMLFFFFF
jgi:hypothetical protein